MPARFGRIQSDAFALSPSRALVNGDRMPYFGGGNALPNTTAADAVRSVRARSSFIAIYTAGDVEVRTEPAFDCGEFPEPAKTAAAARRGPRGGSPGAAESLEGRGC